MNWKPIKTAPKDGTVILAAYQRNDGNGWAISTAWWDDKFDLLRYCEKKQKPRYRGAWTDGGVGSFTFEEYNEVKPAYWMPLPQPPEDTK